MRAISYKNAAKTIKGGKYSVTPFTPTALVSSNGTLLAVWMQRGQAARWYAWKGRSGSHLARVSVVHGSKKPFLT
jgi:hypothetical protein